MKAIYLKAVLQTGETGMSEAGERDDRMESEEVSSRRPGQSALQKKTILT